jgi:Flp pilus assembly protein TadB
MTERPTVAGAMARADSAHQKIEDHEDLCAERYRAINTTLGDLKSASGDQSKLLWGIVLSIAGFTAVTLVAVVLHALRLA